MASKRTDLCIRNDTPWEMNITVDGIDNHDWDGDSRPDKNFQNVKLGANQSKTEREELNFFSRSAPYNMHITFENGDKIDFRNDQRDALKSYQREYGLGGQSAENYSATQSCGNGLNTISISVRGNIRMEEGDLIYVPNSSCSYETSDGQGSLTGHIGILAKDDNDGMLKVCEAFGESATTGNVRFRTIQEFVSDNSYESVLLYHVNLDDDRKKNAAFHAKSKLGQPYSLFLSGIIPTPYDVDNEPWYCSKFVYLSYKIGSNVELHYTLALAWIWPGSLVDHEQNPFVEFEKQLKP